MGCECNMSFETIKFDDPRKTCAMSFFIMPQLFLHSDGSVRNQFDEIVNVDMSIMINHKEFGGATIVKPKLIIK